MNVRGISTFLPILPKPMFTLGSMPEKMSCKIHGDVYFTGDDLTFSFTGMEIRVTFPFSDGYVTAIELSFTFL